MGRLLWYWTPTPIIARSFFHVTRRPKTPFRHPRHAVRSKKTCATMMLRPDHLQTLRESSSSTSKMTIIEAVDGMQNNQIHIAMIISYTDTEVTLVILSSFVRPIPLRMYSFSSAWIFFFEIWGIWAFPVPFSAGTNIKRSTDGAGTSKNSFRFHGERVFA